MSLSTRWLLGIPPEWNGTLWDIYGVSCYPPRYVRGIGVLETRNRPRVGSQNGVINYVSFVLALINFGGGFVIGALRGGEFRLTIGLNFSLVIFHRGVGVLKTRGGLGLLEKLGTLVRALGLGTIGTCGTIPCRVTLSGIELPSGQNGGTIFELVMGIGKYTSLLSFPILRGRRHIER